MKKTLLQFAWAVVNLNLVLWVAMRDTLLQIEYNQIPHPSDLSYGNSPMAPGGTIEFVPNPDKKAN